MRIITGVSTRDSTDAADTKNETEEEEPEPTQMRSSIMTKQPQGMKDYHHFAAIKSVDVELVRYFMQENFVNQ